MVGMPNKLAAYSSGGTLWLPVKVLWSFVVIDNDDVVKGKVFSNPMMDAKSSYHFLQDLLMVVLLQKFLHDL